MKDNNMAEPWRRAARISALVGAVAWLGLLAVALPEDRVTNTISRLLMVAPLVIVPLALSLVHRGAGAMGPMLRAAIALQPVGAALAVGSLFVAPRGLLAAGLAVPWVGIMGLAALHALDRRRRAGLTLEPLADWCVDIALLYVPVGAGWWVLSRYGAQPMDFDPLIVQLTAIHFHYAGLAAPMIAGMVGRAMADSPPLPARLYRVGALAVIAGPPLVAIGITVSPLMEVICAVVLALGLLVLSGLMVFHLGPRTRNPVAWVLVTVSGLSLVLTMALACTYALGEYLDHRYILIPRMAEIHGVANVFGFSLCGLLAFVVAPPPSPRA